LESIGLYHQTGDGTSRSPEKKYITISSMGFSLWGLVLAKNKPRSRGLRDALAITQENSEHPHGKEVPKMWLVSTTSSTLAGKGLLEVSI
jgi:hypothetical protein